MPRLISAASAFLVLAMLAGPAPAADLQKYAPNDSDLIAHLDIDKLLGSPFVTKYAPALAERYGLELLQALCGDSPLGQKLLKEHRESLQKAFKDRDEVLKKLDGFRKGVGAVLLAGKVNGGDDEMMLVFRCDLDAGKADAVVTLLQAVAGDGLKVGKADDAGLYRLEVPGEEEVWYFAVVEKGVLVFTPSKAYAQEALAKAVGKKKPELAEEVRALLGKVDTKQTFWLAALDKDEELSVTGGARVDAGLRAEFVVTAKDARAAKEHADDANDFLKGLAEPLEKLTAGRKELAPLVEAFKQIKAEAKDNRIVIRAEITSQVLDQVLGKAK